MRTDPCFHRWGNTKRLMHADEIVPDVEECDGVNVGLDLLGERIGKPSEAAHLHPHGEVLALHCGRGKRSKADGPNQWAKSLVEGGESVIVAPSDAPSERPIRRFRPPNGPTQGPGRRQVQGVLGSSGGGCPSAVSDVVCC